MDALLSGGDDLPTSLAMFAVAAVVVWIAGSRLAGYAGRFATATGLGGALVGLVLLGGVTSLPEIAASATAAIGGSGALAANTLIGGVAL
jgi:cation:H+ antiporter